MIYTDFTLRIVADGAGLRVLAESTAGQASSPLELPESIDVYWRDRRPKQEGENLFRALFAGDVGHLFDSARGELNGTSDRGLRLRLHLDPRDPRLRRLGHLAWEGMRCPVTASFLALDRRTPVVRCLDVPKPTQVPPLAPPLRVLLVSANPQSTDKLKLDEESKQIATVLKRLDGIELSTLENATRKSLRQRVREGTFHVVHFMGHGAFDEATAEGAIYLETPEGEADPFPAKSLANLFNGPEKPSLVVLNACDTARATDHPDLDPFAGVATALLLSGVPSVLAMAQPVADASALELAEELYRRLVLGDPVEAAVVEARLALETSDDDPESWTIPIHFLRPFAPELPRNAKPVEEIVKPPSPSPPLRDSPHFSVDAGEIKGGVYQAESMVFHGKPGRG